MTAGGAHATTTIARARVIPALRRRRRVLLAPIPITPTKPLTPSHVKALLWLDALYKTTRRLHEVTYLHNRTTFDSTQQTLGFWAHLDERFPGFDYTRIDEGWVGERYVEHHLARRTIDPDALSLRERAVSAHGWVHPASLRVLARWEEQYALLGLHDPGLLRAEPLKLGAGDALDVLRRLDLVLDARSMGGGVFLDLTDEGLPLRPIVSADGTANYLLFALRELLDAAAAHEHTLLLCDEDLGQDYLLLQRVLRRAGHAAHRMTLGRVPIGGSTASSRHGGWRDHTLEKLVAPVRACSTRAIRLGMRLYFIAALGKTSKQDLRPDLLHAFVRRAERLLDKWAGGVAERCDPSFLEKWVRDDCYVDPYGPVSLLLSPHIPSDTAAFLISLLCDSP